MKNIIVNRVKRIAAGMGINVSCNSTTSIYDFTKACAEMNFHVNSATFSVEVFDNDTVENFLSRIYTELGNVNSREMRELIGELELTM